MNDYSVKKDSDLVELTLLGQENAYAELVTRHERAVKGTAYKTTGNTYSAEDAAQDAFVSAWMKLSSLRERDKFGSWVCAIAKNHARYLVSHYQSAAADISLHLLENLDLSGADDELLGRLSAAKAAQLDRDERLHEAVEALGDKIRETITLHYFEGLSVNEIAQKLSLPAGTVKWRLCEGRKQLRKEYGVMETTYNENEALVRRVMRQIEQLKLWRLKNDLTGFEAEYRAVLAAVEALEDSADKEHARADVLMHGYWWLPGEEQKATLSQIKQSAERGLNDEVIESVLWHELGHRQGKERLEMLLGTQLPYLEQHGFRNARGFAWFWTAVSYIQMGDDGNAFAAFSNVLDILTPAHAYYANALAAMDAIEQKRRFAPQTDDEYAYNASAEVFKRIGGKLYFWSQPGFSQGMAQQRRLYSLFWNLAQCDNLLYDASMRVGDTVTASDGRATLTLAEDGVTVTTPAGTFENCSVWITENGEYIPYCKTVLCPDVGIVYQYVKNEEEVEWRLASYTVNGGEGLLPFACGNRWEYTCDSEEGILSTVQNRFEVVYAENDTVVLSGMLFRRMLGFDEDSWNGNVIKARCLYVCHDHDGEEHLRDMRKALDRAEALAATPRQKRHTAIARDVLHRILMTDPAFNPDYTEKGRWNFFERNTVSVDDGVVKLNARDRTYGFEWKDMRCGGWENNKMLYNFLYDILSEATGCVWSEKWVPGFHLENKNNLLFGRSAPLVLDVLGDETVTTAAGTFDNCRHIVLDVKLSAPGYNYRGGKKDYWFALGVGIVKMVAYCEDGNVHTVWELTSYTGTGEGYFPVADGFVRRYEPIDLSDDYRASVEYTFDVERDSTVLFRNATGVQKRAAFEAMT